MIPDVQPAVLAPLLVRLLLGMLFLAQGYDKVFNIGIGQVVATITPAYRKIRFPQFMVRLSAYFTSFAELAGGLLLIAGLFKSFTLALLGADLLVVSLGFCLLNPVWDLNHVFYRFAMLVFLMVYPAELDTITLDLLWK